MLSFQHTINHRELGLSHNGTTSAMFNHHELHAHHAHHTPLSKRLDKCDPNTPSISIAWESAAIAWCTGYTKRSWKMFHDFLAIQKMVLTSHITSRLEEKTVGFMFCWSEKRHSFCTQVSITSALTIGLRVNRPSSSSSWWLLVHVTCDLVWSYQRRFMDLVSIALKALAKKLQQLEILKINWILVPHVPPAKFLWCYTFNFAVVLCLARSAV